MAERLVQLCAVVLFFLMIPGVESVRITVALEGYDLVDILSVLVDGVQRRNAHGSINSRKSL